jgi:type II secretory pathway pseudopilin PulG
MRPSRHSRRSARFGRSAMTLSEILIAATLFGVLLAVLMLGMDGIRTELKRRQALDLLNTLDRALLAYHQAVKVWPVDPGSPPAPPPAADHPPAADPDEASGNRVISVLAAVPASRTVLQTIPAILRVPVDVPSGAGTPVDAGASAGAGIPSRTDFGVQDPWGRPLCCLTAASRSAVHRKTVAANENRPIFIIAGPDGNLGFTDVAAASDNLRSDELGK